MKRNVCRAFFSFRRHFFLGNNPLFAFISFPSFPIFSFSQGVLIDELKTVSLSPCRHAGNVPDGPSDPVTKSRSFSPPWPPFFLLRAVNVGESRRSACRHRLDQAVLMLRQNYKQEFFFFVGRTSNVSLAFPCTPSSRSRQRCAIR